MTSKENIECQFKDFETHRLRLEQALEKAFGQVRSWVGQDVASNTTSPYLLAAEAIGIGFYLAEKLDHLVASYQELPSSPAEE